MQLEKAFHIQNSGGVQTNSTLTAILETKDARIATLEKEVKLLEHELDRQRERDFGTRDYVNVTSPFLDHPLPSHTMGFKHQVSGAADESASSGLSCT